MQLSKKRETLFNLFDKYVLFVLPDYQKVRAHTAWKSMERHAIFSPYSLARTRKLPKRPVLH